MAFPGVFNGRLTRLCEAACRRIGAAAVPHAASPQARRTTGTPPRNFIAGLP